MDAESPRRRPVRRGVLGLGVLVGVVLAAYVLVPSSVQPGHRPLGRDFYIFYAAAEAFLRGEAFVGYTAEIGGRSPSYVYPPITILAFVPYAIVLERTAAFGLHAVLDAAAMAAVGGLAVRTVEHHRGRLPTADRILVVAFCLASPVPMMAIGLGQIDPLIALGLAGAFVAVETGRQPAAGAAVALAGVFKVIPALVGVWLVYRRAWRALQVAVGVGATTVAASVLLFGLDAHRRYVSHVLEVRSRMAAFEATGAPVEFSVTLAQPVAFLVPGLDDAFYPVVAAVLLAPVLGVLFRRADDVVDRLVAFLGTVCVVLLVSPASNFTWVVYLFFPLLGLVYLVEHRGTRRWYLAGLALFAVPFQKYQPRAIAELAGVADAYAATAGPVVETVLAFGTVPLFGVLLVLVGCGVYHYSGRDRLERPSDVTVSD